MLAAAPCTPIYASCFQFLKNFPSHYNPVTQPMVLMATLTVRGHSLGTEQEQHVCTNGFVFRMPWVPMRCLILHKNIQAQFRLSSFLLCSLLQVVSTLLFLVHFKQFAVIPELGSP